MQGFCCPGGQTYKDSLMSYSEGEKYRRRGTEVGPERARFAESAGAFGNAGQIPE